jgi:SAM-dependent methyltransferase
MNVEKPSVSAEPIMRACSAYWITGILGAAVSHGLFTHISAGADTAGTLCERAAISERGCQAILDGLVAIGLLEVNGTRYSNTPAASAYLIEGGDEYLGTYVEMNFARMARWPELTQAVRTGQSVMGLSGVPDHPYWEELVSSIAPLSLPIARAVASRLAVAEATSLSLLDVAGGGGAFAAVFLGENPRATATQVDWANVNRVARRFVGRHVGASAESRFHTLDGDFLETDYGDGAFDVAIYSHMAHGVSAAANEQAFVKLRRALKPGGTLVVHDLIVGDDNRGQPLALMFGANLLFHSADGRGWREGDYRRWLAHAGFANVTIEPTSSPSTLIYAS